MTAFNGITVVAGYLICSILAFGMMNAEWHASSDQASASEMRGACGTFAILSAGGPASLVVGLVVSGASNGLRYDCGGYNKGETP